MTDIALKDPNASVSRWDALITVPCQSHLCEVLVSGAVPFPDAMTVHDVHATGDWNHHAAAVTAQFGDPAAPYCWQAARRIETHLARVLPSNTVADDYLTAAVTAASLALCWEPEPTYARLVAALVARSVDTSSSSILWAAHPALERFACDHTERFMNPGGHPIIRSWPDDGTRRRWETVWGDGISCWAANWWREQHRYDPRQAFAIWRELSQIGTHDGINSHYPRDPGSVRTEL